MIEGFKKFSQHNFERDVLNQKGLTVIDFWSESCVPCRQLAKILKQLVQEVPDSVTIGSVKAEENIELLERFNIRTTPTLLFIKDGELVETRTGVDRRQVIKKLVETYA